MMEIIPAIDLKGGRCVRLVQGEMDQETVYYNDPLEAAFHWVDQGAGRIHVVDLDGAVEGESKNLPVVKRIAETIPVPIQLGGGIRSEEHIQHCLGIGVERVILGTMACQEPKRVTHLLERYPQKILLGLDARDGFLAIKGWKEPTGTRVTDLLESYSGLPAAGIIYTDIKRDGMLIGPNIQAIESLLQATSIPVIASGGVTTAQDVTALSKLEPSGLSGAIVGKALYSGTLGYRDACKAAETG